LKATKDRAMRRLRRTHRHLRAPLAALGDARAPCLRRTWEVSDDRRTARNACVAEEPAEPAIEARPQDCGRRRCRAPVLFGRNRRVRLPLKSMALSGGAPRTERGPGGARIARTHPDEADPRPARDSLRSSRAGPEIGRAH